MQHCYDPQSSAISLFWIHNGDLKQYLVESSTTVDTGVTNVKEFLVHHQTGRVTCLTNSGDLIVDLFANQNTTKIIEEPISRIFHSSQSQRILETRLLLLD